MTCHFSLVRLPACLGLLVGALGLVCFWLWVWLVLCTVVLPFAFLFHRTPSPPSARLLSLWPFALLSIERAQLSWTRAPLPRLLLVGFSGGAGRPFPALCFAVSPPFPRTPSPYSRYCCGSCVLCNCLASATTVRPSLQHWTPQSPFYYWPLHCTPLLASIFMCSDYFCFCLNRFGFLRWCRISPDGCHPRACIFRVPTVRPLGSVAGSVVLYTVASPHLQLCYAVVGPRLSPGWCLSFLSAYAPALFATCSTFSSLLFLFHVLRPPHIPLQVPSLVCLRLLSHRTV